MLHKLVNTTPHVRRSVTVPSYVVGWLAMTTLSPLWILIGGLAGVARRRSFVVLRLLAFLWYYLTTALLVLSAYAVCRVILGDSEERVLRLSTRYGNALFRGCARLLSLRVEIEGDGVDLCGPLIVLVRHTSIVDAAIPAMVFAASGTQLRYVLRRELVLDPWIDVATSSGTHCLVNRSGSPVATARKIAALGKSIGEHAIVLYPEGTRFSAAKRVAAIEALRETRAELADLAESMVNVLPPKPVGVLQLLSVSAADCLVVSHRGLDGFSGPRDFLGGHVVGKRIHVGLHRVRTACVAPEDRTLWLFRLWHDVDQYAELSER